MHGVDLRRRPLVVQALGRDKLERVCHGNSINTRDEGTFGALLVGFPKLEAESWMNVRGNIL